MIFSVVHSVARRLKTVVGGLSLRLSFIKLFLTDVFRFEIPSSVGRDHSMIHRHGKRIKGREACIRPVVQNVLPPSH